MWHIRSEFACSPLSTQGGKVWLRGLQGVCSLIILAFLVHFWMIPSQSEPMQKDLEKEFKLISPLPQATLNSYDSSHKDQHALIEGDYSTALNYDHIKSYYVAELQKNGWKFQQELKIKDYGRDQGGKQVVFCKGKNRATLFYAGASANNGWTYALSLSWGLLPDICRKIA